MYVISTNTKDTIIVFFCFVLLESRHQAAIVYRLCNILISIHFEREMSLIKGNIIFVCAFMP